VKRLPAAAIPFACVLVCCLATVSCQRRSGGSESTADSAERPPGLTLAIRNGRTTPLDLVPGQQYVFDRITLEAENRDIPDTASALQWLRTESSFRGLNWTGVRESRAYWRNYKETRIDADVFSHVFDGAAWMDEPNSLQVSVLGAGGTPLGEPLRISNGDFLNRLKQWDFDMIRAEYRLENLARHKDQASARTRRAVAKVVFAIQTDLSRRLAVPAAAETLRIVWDKTPDEPYDFPIRLLPSPLAYGLRIEATLEPRKDVYQPGDVIRATFTALDGRGNPLKLSEFPRNGLTRLFVHLDGPRQQPTFYHQESLNDFRGNRYADHLRAPELGLGSENGSLITPRQAAPLDADGTRMVVDLQVPRNLPARAYGTYMVSAAAGRLYGSQQADVRLEIPVQVGTPHPTSFEEFGCASCHGAGTPTDLARLIPPMSGIEPLNVDDFQDCVFCHDNSRDGSRRLGKVLHLLHMNRDSFAAPKNNCAVCHIQDGTIRTVGFEACAPCHQQLHDTSRPKYTDRQCQLCHADPAPGHIVGTRPASR
jgi:hypothetical protein